MNQPQTIEVFLPAGDPAGIRHAVLTTRTVRVWDIPRQLLSSFLEEQDSSKVAIYFLTGIDSNEVPQGYIGQTGNIGKRLAQHLNQRNFWNRALVAVCMSDSWHDSHVRYMEKQAISMARESGRYALQNGNSASSRGTTPSIESACNEFLKTISLLTSMLGAPILEPVKLHPRSPVTDLPAQRKARSRKPVDKDTFYLKTRGCNAQGAWTENGMIVFAGSVGRGKIRESSSAWVPKLRDRLQTQGVIRIEGDSLTFLQDYTFSSSSSACSVMMGGASSGRKYWKNAEGRTLGQIHDEKAGTQG